MTALLARILLLALLAADWYEDPTFGQSAFSAPRASQPCLEPCRAPQTRLAPLPAAFAPLATESLVPPDSLPLRSPVRAPSRVLLAGTPLIYRHRTILR